MDRRLDGPKEEPESARRHGVSAHRLPADLMDALVHPAIRSELALRGDERVLEVDAAQTGSIDPMDGSAYDVAIGHFGTQCAADPARYVHDLVSATKPGGRIAFVDEADAPIRTMPEVEGFDALWTAYRSACNRAANWRTHSAPSPDSGRSNGTDSLPELIHAAGARPSRIATVLGACRSSDRRFQALTAALVRSLRAALPSIRAAGQIDGVRAAATIDALDAWRDRPDAVLCCAAQIVEARRRVGIIAMTP